MDEWWHEPLDLPGLEKKYGPRIDGIERTQVFIIEHGTRAIGWIQWYRWSDYPDHAAQVTTEPDSAGMDLAIGEVAFVGRGIGSTAIRKFAREVIFAAPGVNAIVTDPEERNARSRRAFEKAGFIPMQAVQLKGERVRRRIMRLSLPVSSTCQPTIRARGG